MINGPILLPTNRDVRPKVDPRWPMAFASLALISVLLAATLALVGWPRLRSVSLHYDLVTLREEVEGLRRQERLVETELETLRAPQAIAHQAEELGLVYPSPALITVLPENAE